MQLPARPEYGPPSLLLPLNSNTRSSINSSPLFRPPFIIFYWFFVWDAALIFPLVLSRRTVLKYIKRVYNTFLVGSVIVSRPGVRSVFPHGRTPYFFASTSCWFVPCPPFRRREFWNAARPYTKNYNRIYLYCQ